MLRCLLAASVPHVLNTLSTVHYLDIFRSSSLYAGRSISGDGISLRCAPEMSYLILKPLIFLLSATSLLTFPLTRSTGS
jgi:hypothetical protein